jgi:DNA-3-methyladenine glycosylase
MTTFEQLLSGNDVVRIAKQLIGSEIFTKVNGVYTSGIITETEAYAGENDRASHAFGGKRTARTETMYRKSGTAYIYLCYGMHHLFNIVTGPEGTPHAVLLRGIFPLTGNEWMRERMNKPSGKLQTIGPGRASKALGISTSQNGIQIDGSVIGLKLPDVELPEFEIITGRRIGVDYAGLDAELPYRFFINKPELHFNP